MAYRYYKIEEKMMNTLRPEALYKKTNLVEMEIIPFETAVVGTAIRFDTNRREVVVDLGYGFTGIIPEDEVTVYDFTYPEGKDTPTQITSIIGTQVRAIVTEVISEDTFKMSRKMSMKQAWEMLEENKNVIAYIIRTIELGVFLDIGNGLISYSNRKESTAVLISDARLWFKAGETTWVRILEKGNDETQKITCSIRAAYPSLEEINLKVEDIIAVRIGKLEVPGGYFCEVNHHVQGIIDSSKELIEGQMVRGVIKKITEKGIKIRYLE